MTAPALQHFRSDRRLAASSAWAVALALLAQLLLAPLLPAATWAGEAAICLAAGDEAPDGPAGMPADDRRDRCPLCRLTATAVVPPPPAHIVAPIAPVAIAFVAPAAAQPTTRLGTGHAQPRAPPAL